MRQRTFDARVKKVLAEEMASSEQWFYCSFANDVHGGFLGGLIMYGFGPVDISIRAGALGINPGGQMICLELSDDNVPPEKYRDRLLSEDDIREIWPDAKTIREFEEDEDHGPSLAK